MSNETMLDETPKDEEEKEEHQGRQTDMQLVMIKPVHVIEADSHKIIISGHEGTIFLEGDSFPLSEPAVMKSPNRLLTAFANPKPPLKQEAVYEMVDRAATELDSDNPVMK